MPKQKKNKKKKRKILPHKSLLKLKNSKLKMSEIMCEFADDYIQLGEDLERKHNLLNSAISAWNIASLPPERRTEALDKYIEAFRVSNPHIEIDDANYLKGDMELLTKNKLEKFDHIKRQIFNAQLYEENDILDTD
ncbi:MAG: hypothetical protein JSW07_12875 [bacterium]|nr:MAG: hypothetical protein JSW07_12875 [bacterium]